MVHVRLDNVSIDFPIYGASGRSLKKTLLRGVNPSRVSHDARNRITVHALRNVSLELRDGDRVGLVGPNGAGKSTLLRTIAGIYEPSHGRVHVEGNVTTLFSLNFGIDEDATGFENIALRGLAAGMSRAEIDERAVGVAEFTELGEYLNFPVYTYSAGMKARLAFAISTATAPEILLMDEWIGAGDASFIEKARKRVSALVDAAGILVLASHNESLVKRICNKIVEFDAGRVLRIVAAEEYYRSKPENEPRSVAAKQPHKQFG